MLKFRINAQIMVKMWYWLIGTQIGSNTLKAYLKDRELRKGNRTASNQQFNSESKSAIDRDLEIIKKPGN